MIVTRAASRMTARASIAGSAGSFCYASSASMAFLCPKCGKPMSITVVRCPHCGAIEPDRDPRVPTAVADREPAKLSPAEAAVLLETGSEPHSFARDFFLPSANLHGWRSALDVLLLLLSLPLALGVAITLVPTLRRHRRPVTTGHIAENVIVALLGGVMVLIFAWRGHQLEAALPTVGFAALALAGRVALRIKGMPEEE